MKNLQIFLFPLLFVCGTALAFILIHLARGPLKAPVAHVAIDASLRSVFSHFPSEHSDGFVGGDVATSIVLTHNESDARVLYLFGDTLYGQVQNGERSILSMPRNSIALWRSNSSLLQHYVKVNESHLADEYFGFFQAQQPRQWLWLVSGFMASDSRKLYLFGYSVKADADGGAFGFVETESVMVRVENPLDAPQRWQYTQHRFEESQHASLRTWGTAVYQEDGFLYILGAERAGKTILARVPLDRLDQWNFDDFQVRLGDGWHAWDASRPSDQLESIAASGTTETSLIKVPDGANSYYAFFAIDFLSTQLSIFTAREIFGPYEKKLLWDIVPPWSNTTIAFCYAPKVHLHLSQPQKKQYVLTIMSNTFKLDDLKTNLEYYVPLPIKVQL